MTKPTKLKVTEAQEQMMFIEYLKTKGIRFNHSPNGGKRNVIEAAKFKRMGVSSGFPDIEIPLPCGKYHGFYIEFKPTKGGRLTPNQVDWLNYLNEKGYYAQCAHGFDEALEILEHYLNFK